MLFSLCDGAPVAIVDTVAGTSTTRARCLVNVPVQVHAVQMRATFAGAGLLMLCLLGACGSAVEPLAEGETLPPGEPRTWELSVHCGAGFLSYQINGTWWRTAEAGDGMDWMPPEWPSAREVSGITVVLEVNEAGDELKVTYADHTVIYQPTELTDSDLCA